MVVLSFDQLYKTKELKQMPAILSIGVYDGMHIGHQRIIGTTVELAQKEEGTKSAILTFSQNPKTLLGRNPYDKPLMSLRQFTETLIGQGVDYLVVIDFSPEFSKLTGEEFIARCCDIFAVRAVVVGENFRCGLKADTGVKELKELLPRYAQNAQLHVPSMYTLLDGTIDSSTIVRRTLTQGRVAEIPNQLGRHYSVDLAHIPSRNSGYPLLFAISSFVQLLPPPGAYESVLVLEDRSTVAVIAVVGQEFLELRSNCESEKSVFPAGSATVRYDNLQFVKELT
ncbi:MAG: FAD synthetase family protein [Sphaerochaetaceae bacterium]